MKGERRLPYLVLNDIELPEGGNAILCSFCKHAAWCGGCKKPEVECEHPLVQKVLRLEDLPINAEDGSDCFLFKPSIRREDAVDIVGIWLQGKQPDWETVRSPKREEHEQRKVD